LGTPRFEPGCGA